MGGITGLLLANVGIDVLLHDTYFVVAHFHYVLSLGAVVGVLSGMLHFIARWTFSEYSFFYVFVCFFVFLGGSNFVFLPLHSLGLLSFPRRLSDYRVSSPGRGVEGFRGTCLDELSEGAVELEDRGEVRNEGTIGGGYLFEEDRI